MFYLSLSFTRNVFAVYLLVSIYGCLSAFEDEHFPFFPPVLKSGNPFPFFYWDVWCFVAHCLTVYLLYSCGHTIPMVNPVHLPHIVFLRSCPTFYCCAAVPELLLCSCLTGYCCTAVPVVLLCSCPTGHSYTAASLIISVQLSNWSFLCSCLFGLSWAAVQLL